RVPPAPPPAQVFQGSPLGPIRTLGVIRALETPNTGFGPQINKLEQPSDSKWGVVITSHNDPHTVRIIETLLNAASSLHISEIGPPNDPSDLDAPIFSPSGKSKTVILHGGGVLARRLKDVLGNCLNIATTDKIDVKGFGEWFAKQMPDRRPMWIEIG